MRLESASAREKALARLAGNQHGVVSFQQPREIGFTQPAIARRVRAGRLHRLHRGVYAVGHTRLTDEGRWKAAVLACGPGAALSHRAAAASWRMLPAPKGPIDVTVPGHDGRKRRKGLRLHRSNSLHPAQTTLRAGIPVTTPARTLADLRRYMTPDELREAQRQAEPHGYRLDSQDTLSDLTRSELEPVRASVAATRCLRPR